MKILVFADVHYYGGDIETALFNTEKKLVKYALPLLEKLTDLANGGEIDLCVNLGDIIQDMNDKQADLQSLQMMFDRLRRIQPPCYSVLGNHDLKMMDTVEEVEALLGAKSTFSLDIDGYHLVFLTTQLRPELGLGRGGIFKTQYLSDETLEFLKNDLAKNTRPCLVFTHFALAEDDTIEDECLFMKNRAAVKEIIREDKNVLAVFSGHQHITKTLVEDGVPYYVLGSLTACGDQPGVPCGVYFEIELCDGQMTVSERRALL